MPTRQRFRLDNRHDLQDRRKPSIHLDEDPAVVICEPSPALQLSAQDYQLMSENRILRLKPVLRLEWRGQHGQNEADQRLAWRREAWKGPLVQRRTTGL